MWMFQKMCARIASVICCAFLVLNANASPIDNYDKQPFSLAKQASLRNSNQIFLDETKLFYIDPRQQIKASLVETSNEDILDSSGFSSVLCEAGKTSRWLHCTDPSGEIERSEAEKICQAHGQTLWTYAPKTSYQSDYGFWICSVTRKHAGRKPSF